MIRKYGVNLQLCYMDTDSLVYDIATDDFYEDIAGDIPTQFDTSSYSCSCPLPMRVIKTVIGLMKDELGRKIMTKFVALRPKLCTYRTLCGMLARSARSQEVCGESSRITSSGRNIFRKQLMFWNKLHEVHAVEVNKVALSRNDNKRVIHHNGVSTLANGHKNTT